MCHCSKNVVCVLLHHICQCCVIVLYCSLCGTAAKLFYVYHCSQTIIVTAAKLFSVCHSMSVELSTGNQSSCMSFQVCPTVNRR